MPNETKAGRMGTSETPVYQTVIEQFQENVSAIREFVELVSPALMNVHRDLFHDRDGKSINFFQSFIDGRARVAQITVEEDSEQEQPEHPIQVRNAGDHMHVTLHVDDAKAAAVGELFERLGRAGTHWQLLLRSSLMTLTSMMEWMFADLVRRFYTKYPNAMGVKDKFFSMEDLERVKTVEEARSILVEDRVESLMRKSFDDWIGFWKGDGGIQMPYSSEDLMAVAEVFQRRNLIVHNDGKVNSIYLSKVTKQLRETLNVGSRLGVSREYLFDAIDVSERTGLLIAFELWRKHEPTEDEERVAFMMDVSFGHLMAERWITAETISRSIAEDRRLPEESRLRGQLNRWQALRWQGRYDEVRAEVEGADFSAKDELFRLARHAVAGEADQFFSLLPAVIAGKKLSADDLRTWPIFREMRTDPRFGSHAPATPAATPVE